MLRIISGEHKGRMIKTLPGRHTRPTANRVKEALFNILQTKLHGSLILDLFSGTGNIGLEAMSRGAEKVVFVEKNPAALHILRENCRSLEYAEFVDILPFDVKKALEILSKQGLLFDIVFMDPPYDKGLEVPTIKHLDQVNLLKETGIIAVEHMSCSVLPRIIGDFIKYDLKKYGKTTISFYRKRSCNQ